MYLPHYDEMSNKFKIKGLPAAWLKKASPDTDPTFQF